MKEKNKKLLIIGSILLLVVGASFAYFVSRILTSGTNSEVDTTTAKIKDATLVTEGKLSFTETDIYPGHKNISSIKLTATGNNELIPYNLIWSGTNSISSLNYTIYKTEEEVNVTSTCEKKTIQEGFTKKLYEECSINNIEELGEKISEGTINKEETKKILKGNEFITALEEGMNKYYYIILEYPNKEEEQNEEGKLQGEVGIEEPSVNIGVKEIKLENEDGTTTFVSSIPKSGYKINKLKSTCTNNAIPEGIAPNIEITNINESGTECSLCFEKYKEGLTAEDLIKNSELVNENGYRYEGSNPNNYVTFNDELWRIIGVFETTKADNSKENLIKIIREESIGNLAWDINVKNNWSTSSLKALLNEGDYYNRSGDYETIGLTLDAKKMIEDVIWNLGGASSEQITTEAMYIAERGSTGANNSTTNITWTGKVGLMYPSDYGYASLSATCARTTQISSYNTSVCAGKNWLNKNSDYWTITPRSSSSSSVFLVGGSGNVTDFHASSVFGASPSLYLKSSVKLVDGDGTSNNPYILG